MRITAPFLYIFLLCLLLLHLEMSSSQLLPPDQISTINRVYQVLGRNDGIGNGSNPCSWNGVICSFDNSSINALAFNSFSISTPQFLPLLCNLTSLESLDVSNNVLTSVPDDFFAASCGVIRGLKVLNFSRNSLNVPLPPFNEFRMLELLDFSFNSLNGEVTTQLEGLSSLKSLNLSHNDLSGTVPITALKNSSLLEGLQLSANSFSRTIPAEITNLTNLRVIDLSVNEISGSIPGDLDRLTRLETLVLSLNNLSGKIPESLSRIMTLSKFAANQNSFTGGIPHGITSYLGTLDLSYTKLAGEIPPDLLSRPNLLSIDMSSNELNGSIPMNISYSLFRLRLGSNLLTGTLPGGSFVNLTELLYLELDNNNLSGQIPAELGMCRKLALLNLAQNQFTGPLPPVLGNLTNLQGLNLQMNNFSGVIPPQITQLNRLLKLNLSRNSLSGLIPESISNLSKLTSLDLQSNRLSGSIPDSIGSLSSLIDLLLGKNQLTGQFPESFFRLQISNLNLSYNLFSGEIPDSMSSLRSLEVLDLSNNRFSGEIPESMTGIKTLTRLILSNNDLSGIIPNFGSFVEVDTEGNNDLIPRGNPGPAPKRKKKSLVTAIAIAIASAASAVGLFTMALFVRRRLSRTRFKGHMLVDDSVGLDISEAMNAACRQANIILKNDFYTYYKALLASGTTCCIKRLYWSNKAFKLHNPENFCRELKFLGQMRNCNVMVPQAYVLTSSSAYLIYERCHYRTLYDLLHLSTGSTVSWEDRYAIGVGVAAGLCFLHGYSSSTAPIVLLNLSTANIVMSSDKEPMIGDSELAKVIDPSSTMGTLSVVAGAVGYIPPEYPYTMRVSASGNVYSLGVIMLELLTGKPAISEGTELTKHVRSMVVSHDDDEEEEGDDKWDNVLDQRVSTSSAAVRHQMKSMLKVALCCIRSSPGERPDAKQVHEMLLQLAG